MQLINQNRRKSLALVLLALCCLLLSACINNRIRFPYIASRAIFPSAGSLATDPLFEYERKPLGIKNRVLTHKETKYYRVKYLRFPSYGENGQKNNLVTANYYQSKLPGKKSLVIVMPIWGVHTYPSTKVAAEMRKRSRGNMNVILIHGDDYLLDWEAMNDAQTEDELIAVMERMAQRVRNNIIDIRRFVDWIETQDDVIPNQIALVGFSLGAMIAGAILANEPRITAGVLVMGGAYPHEVFATCLGRAGNLRETLLKRFGWTVDYYRKILQRVFYDIDPARFPGRVNPERVIMFDSHLDECMPTHAREKLWEIMGYPERISFLYDHSTSFLALTPVGGNYMPKEIYKFLKRTLRPLQHAN